MSYYSGEVHREAFRMDTGGVERVTAPPPPSQAILFGGVVKSLVRSAETG